MNKVYLYDGEFSSLLALIVELMKLKIVPDDIQVENMYQPNLLEEAVYLEVKEQKENIYKLRKVLPQKILGRIYYVYLSNEKGKEKIIYSFIKYAIYYQEKVFYYRRIDCINEVLMISHRVSNEAHKLKGFLRFQRMKSGYFYAEFSSTNFVLPILVKHFQERLKEEDWIIKDEKRNCYALYYHQKVYYLQQEDIVKLNLETSREEDFVEDLWKTFFKTIAIKERENKKCQQNFMPKKYWKNMLEMENEL